MRRRLVASECTDPAAGVEWICSVASFEASLPLGVRCTPEGNASAPLADVAGELYASGAGEPPVESSDEEDEAGRATAVAESGEAAGSGA